MLLHQAAVENDSLVSDVKGLLLQDLGHRPGERGQYCANGFFITYYVHKAHWLAMAVSTLITAIGSLDYVLQCGMTSWRTLTILLSNTASQHPFHLQE